MTLSLATSKCREAFQTHILRMENVSRRASQERKGRKLSAQEDGRTGIWTSAIWSPESALVSSVDNNDNNNSTAIFIECLLLSKCFTWINSYTYLPWDSIIIVVINIIIIITVSPFDRVEIKAQRSELTYWGHTANEWQSQDLNPSSSVLEPLCALSLFQQQ